MDEDNVPEDQCAVCKDWPAAERASRRLERFSTDYISIPIKGVCIFCQLALWTSMGLLKSDDEPQEPPPRH